MPKSSPWTMSFISATRTPAIDEQADHDRTSFADSAPVSSGLRPVPTDAPGNDRDDDHREHDQGRGAAEGLLDPRVGVAGQVADEYGGGAPGEGPGGGGAGAPREGPP